MTSESKVFIAGVGFSPAPPGGSPTNEFIAALVSTATKALLDAGLSYDDVARGVTSDRSHTSIHGSEAFEVFEEGGVAVDEVERGSELHTSFCWVRDRGAPCVLMIAVEESAAVAFVLVSGSFLWSRRYLKDSAALIRESGAPRPKLDGPPGEMLYDVCLLVWVLRGWSHAKGIAARGGRFFYRDRRSQSIELSRADAKAIPRWEEVKYRQDGKHRLGYNPAVETKDISQEDLEAVRVSSKRQKGMGDWTQFDRKGGDKAALSRL
ncbi:hypothetical protein EV356DRAFT_528079 [Viridothelium virens]|uniref:Thiolase-like protein type 1 additional C-terminal domain-containing protein n=1 Tax=Viridothelium virens TaxID=1048519 RepID=A0A6A6HNB1_VIRVR|nr:hypothetical protein EV356DRAFT_528079 [Viridothelium virens]